jgi:hypothetical protein
MNLKSLIKKSLFFLLLLTVLIPSPVYAQEEVNTREKLQFDENLADQRETDYMEPDKILITQISTEADNLSYDSEVWVKSLYYYMITRQGFADIPYNYLIDREGKVYQGRNGYSGVVPELSESEGAVLIGYLSNGSDLPMSAENTLTNLVEEIIKDYKIERKDVEAVELEIVGGVQAIDGEVEQDTEVSFAKFEYRTVSNVFSANLTKALAKVNFEIERPKINTFGEVVDLQYQESVRIGESFPVKLKLQNVSDDLWFTNREYIYLSTDDNGESPYFINGEWDSATKPLHVEDETVLPGESIELTFDMDSGYLPTENDEKVDESFVFWYGDSENEIHGTQFTISFKVEKGDKRIIQITDTGSDWINIRECPSRNCEVLKRFDVGGYVEVIEDRSSWFKVKYDREKVGWIVSSYYREI